METDSLLKEYFSYLRNPDSIPSDQYAQSLANRIIVKYGQNKANELIGKERKRITALENMLKFIETVEKEHLNPDAILEKRIEKESALKKYAYPTGDEGAFLPGLSDEKLGKFFNKIYHYAKVKLNE